MSRFVEPAAKSEESAVGLGLRVALNDQGTLTAAQSGGPAGALEWLEGSRFRTATNKNIGFELIAQGEIGRESRTME